MEVDWENNNAAIASNFRVHEALWLPSWRIYHIPSEEEKAEIIKTSLVMQQIREIVNAPITVHCWIRPVTVNAPDTPHHGKNYNLYIGSRATSSPHIFGRAVDFHVNGYLGATECNKIREILRPKLEQWEIRMENIDGGWIHIDTNPVRNNRYFKP